MWYSRDSGSKAKKAKTKKAEDIVDVYFENTTVYLAEGALDGVVGVGVGVGCGKLLVVERHCGEIEVGAHVVEEIERFCEAASKPGCTSFETVELHSVDHIENTVDRAHEATYWVGVDGTRGQ